MSDQKVAAMLRLMAQPRSVRLTPELARDVCLRANNKAYVDGSIAKLGSEYVLQLKAVNCQTGDSLAEAQHTADSKEKVLGALGGAVATLCWQLGESLATVQRFDVPLPRKPLPHHSTPSKSFTLAQKNQPRERLCGGSTLCSGRYSARSRFRHGLLPGRRILLQCGRSHASQ